jgi:hypothetical protein
MRDVQAGRKRSQQTSDDAVSTSFTIIVSAAATALLTGPQPIGAFVFWTLAAVQALRFSWAVWMRSRLPWLRIGTLCGAIGCLFMVVAAARGLSLFGLTSQWPLDGALTIWGLLAMLPIGYALEAWSDTDEWRAWTAPRRVSVLDMITLNHIGRK